MVTSRAFDEMVDFITSAPLPEQILTFKPSTTSILRLEKLLDKKRSEMLSLSEQQELDQFLLVEHLMRMAKARAKQRLTR